MRPFTYSAATDPMDAVRQMAAGPGEAARYLAGGTTIIDLMKLDVERPTSLIDISGLDPRYAAIERGAAGLRIGALARMADVAEHPVVLKDYPMLAQSLALAASQQLRNMARIGGNVLQRTRCAYFRDVTYRECNKRAPGSGCAALDGFNRGHAVLGTSAHCIATYAGDCGQALIALDAHVELLGPRGARSIRFADLHVPPGRTPHVETTLQPGELITAFVIRGRSWPRSLFRKVRNRQSYEFAVASAAVALDLDGDVVRDVRLAVGGMSTTPWRATAAEAALVGRPLDEAAAAAAAEKVFDDARTLEHNGFKPSLGKATLVRALLEAKAIET